MVKKTEVPALEQTEGNKKDAPVGGSPSENFVKPMSKKETVAPEAEIIIELPKAPPPRTSPPAGTDGREIEQKNSKESQGSLEEKPVFNFQNLFDSFLE